MECVIRRYNDETTKKMGKKANNRYSQAKPGRRYPEQPGSVSYPHEYKG